VASPLECIVACDDDDVALFARQNGASVVLTPSTDLNGSVQRVYDQLDNDIDSVMIAHGDLSRPDGLAAFTPRSDVTIVTDRHGTGTNVLVVPSPTAFRFSFGTNSAARHAATARALELGVEMVTDSPWGFDVDGPDDLKFIAT
jgi:2-phospho-L-lactate guanylyltransferase (CobY/MobA/RfbA family)